MNVAEYDLTAAARFTRFEFTSAGPKGTIHKLIEFQATTNPTLFNLAFGDKHPTTGRIDDLVVSDNGDTEKVLATVVAALYTFCEHYSDAYVYASGSTRARTRLYRMGITRFYEQTQADFYLYGQVGDNFTEFELGVAYDGFLAQRKFD